MRTYQGSCCKEQTKYSCTSYSGLPNMPNLEGSGDLQGFNIKAEYQKRIAITQSLLSFKIFHEWSMYVCIGNRD